MVKRIDNEISTERIDNLYKSLEVAKKLIGLDNYVETVNDIVSGSNGEDSRWDGIDWIGTLALRNPEQFEQLEQTFSHQQVKPQHQDTRNNGWNVPSGGRPVTESSVGIDKGEELHGKAAMFFEATGIEPSAEGAEELKTWQERKTAEKELAIEPSNHHR